jgi:hypothetical protein
MLTYASQTWILTTRDRKQKNNYKRKLHKRILRPVYENESGGYQQIKKFIKLLQNLP